MVERSNSPNQLQTELGAVSDKFFAVEDVVCVVANPRVASLRANARIISTSDSCYVFRWKRFNEKTVDSCHTDISSQMLLNA